jgi:hypothetical protein
MEQYLPISLKTHEQFSIIFPQSQGSKSDHHKGHNFISEPRVLAQMSLQLLCKLKMLLSLLFFGLSLKK